MSVVWLRVAAALYALGLADTLLTVLRRRSALFPYALGAFCVAAVLHFVAIAEASVAQHHLAANNFYETASLCGLIVAAVFLAVYWRYRFAGLALFLFPLVFLLTLIGSMGRPVQGWEDARLRGAWLLLHIVLVLGGMVALLLSAVGALFYLYQERRLKRKSASEARCPIAFGTLPPLETLDTLVTRAMSVGFVLITLAVVAGSTWASIEVGASWIGDPKIVVSLLTWAFYLAMICLRMLAGWRGRRAAWSALLVLGFSAVTWAAHVGLRPLLIK